MSEFILVTHVRNVAATLVCYLRGYYMKFITNEKLKLQRS